MLKGKASVMVTGLNGSLNTRQDVDVIVSESGRLVVFSDIDNGEHFDLVEGEILTIVVRI